MPKLVTSVRLLDEDPQKKSNLRRSQYTLQMMQ